MTREEKRVAIAAALVDGETIRPICSRLGVGNGLVQRVRTELAFAGVKFRKCPCGRRAGHCATGR